MSKKLKIAWFSKLNLGSEQGDSLGAYASDLLLPRLSRHFEICLFHNSFERYPDFPTYHYLKAFEVDRRERFDIFFYNLENKPYSNFVRSHLGLIPGITYFHDFILSNYGPEPLLNSPYQDIVQIFNGQAQNWPDRQAKHKLKGPQAFREAALSAVAIFTNEQNLNEYRSAVELKLNQPNGDELRSFYLPYPVEFKNSCYSANEQNAIAFASSTLIEGRAHKVLAALRELQKPYRLIWMVAGDERGQAENLLREFEIKDAEIIASKSPQVWSNILEKTRVAVHTHFSVYGHLQPYLGLSLAAGKPCLVSNFGSAEYLPDSLVFKIQPGEYESYEIGAVLNSILNASVEIDSSRISAFAREIFDVEQVAGELASIFREKADYMHKVRAKWKAIEDRAKSSLVSESEQLFTAKMCSADSDWIKSRYETFINPIFRELNWRAD